MELTPTEKIKNDADVPDETTFKVFNSGNRSYLRPVRRRQV